MKLAALSIAGLLIAGAAQAQMALPGKFEVTDTGSASYTIPISIVPGTAGLEPKLSLQYDSRGGNGLLGVGWSLAGLPAITRCGRTIAQDGQVGGVSYDANDRFCLDGQRLIATSGTYGADGTEYRTDRESFSKVVSYGTAGSGPSYFKVWTKAGLIMEFGNTADSRIEAQGKSSVRVWALNKTLDTKGNWFTVSYTEDNANGSYQPSRIDYTGNGSAAPANSVRFVYETRPDVVPLYQAGSLIKTTQRLTKVQAWLGETLVREYRSGFNVSTETAQSRLVSLTQCDAGGGCLPTTAFTWENGSATMIRAGNTAGQDGTHTSNWQFMSGDFNGDGLTDIFALYSSSSDPNANRELWLNKGDGTYEIIANFGGQNPYYRSTQWTYSLVDIDGDGATDIFLMADDGRREIWLSRGRTAAEMTISKIVNPAGKDYSYVPPGWSFEFADFNGDGRIDLFASHYYSREVWLNNGDGTFQTVTNFGGQDGTPCYSGTTWSHALGDFDGDGKTDILVYCPDSTREIWLTRGETAANLTISKIANVAAQNGSYAPPGWGFDVGDFNGDGLADILARHYYYRDLWINKGDGTFQVVSNFGGQDGAPCYSGGVWPHVLVDFDGDGKTDIVNVCPDGHREVWLSRGGSSAPITIEKLTNIAGVDGQYGPPGWNFSVGDFNGDGRPDLFPAHYYYREVWSRQMTGRDVIIGIQPGSSALTTVAYRPLPAGPYSKDIGVAACSFPCVDLQGPLYVVSEVKSSNGLGGEYRSTYRYAGAKSDQHGRGFLGFRQMTVKDEQTGVEQVTTYRQDYPFTGLVASREKTLGALVLNRSTNSYGSTDLGGTRRYPFLTQSLEESWELSGASLPAVTTSYQYDAYGNATQVGFSTGDGHAKTTNNTYSNDATNWLLGRLTRSAVTSTMPGN